MPYFIILYLSEHIGVCVRERAQVCVHVWGQELGAQECWRQRSEGNESGGMIVEGCPQRASDH